MSTDLEQLMRDTLAERSHDITEAPAWDAAHRPASRRRWLPVAAAAAAVVLVGGGITVWQAGRSGDGQSAGGGYPRSCTATLPAAWRTAFTSRGLTIGTTPAVVSAVTPYGEVVEQVTDGGGTRIGLHVSGNGVRVLFQVPKDLELTGTSTDGHDLVLSLSAKSRNGAGTAVRDIAAVDLRTSKVRHVLGTATMPRGTVAAGKAAEVQAGTVYWAAVPRGTEQHPTTGTIVGYRLATGRTAVVGHAPGLLSGPDDPRGVYWSGGGVPAPHVPDGVPALRANGYDPVVSDGANFAWLRSADPRVVAWAGAAGDGRRWSVDTVGRGVRSDPIAVSGPFVFLEPMGYGDPHVFVLDTRTGAVADSGIGTFGGTARGSRVAIVTRPSDTAPFVSVIVDTAHLPGLSCAPGR